MRLRSNARELADEYGVTPNYINRVVRRIERGGTSDDHPRNQATLQRLQAGLTRSGDCLVWTRRCRNGGYGVLSIRNRNVATHRLAYELEHGPIPDGLVVRHKCDNPPCCNPDHLELGTMADNARDMLERGRHWAQKGSAPD